MGIMGVRRLNSLGGGLSSRRKGCIMSVQVEGKSFVRHRKVDTTKDGLSYEDE